MDTVNRSRILFVIVLIVVAGTLFFQRPKPGKSPGYANPLSSNPKENSAGDSNAPNSQVAEANSEKSFCKTTSESSSYATKPQEMSPAEKNASCSRSKNDVFLNSLPLPSRSHLSVEEQAGAISAFESQHTAWLSVKSGSAKYKTSLRIIKNGKFVDAPDSSLQTGTIEFTIAPSDNPLKNESLAHVEVRLSNDKYKWTLTKTDAFGKDSWRWENGSDTAVKIDKQEQVKTAFDMELMFFPVHFMPEAYGEGAWNFDTSLPKEQFFADSGLPIRRTTPEEADSKFMGEPQYLFQFRDAKDINYWFSAEKGELRQIEGLNAKNNMVKTFRYEEYVQKEGEIAKFPRKFIMTIIKGTGSKAAGWEQTVELTDLQLNTNISPDRFIPTMAKQ
jgi:hypothetical protein